MSKRTNRQWRFARYPEGKYKKSDFSWESEPVSDLQTGQFLVKNLMLSMDPTNRAWGWAKDTYMPQIMPGDVMRGIGIGVVEESKHPVFKKGTYVTGMIGWQDYLISDGSELEDTGAVVPFPRDPAVSLSAYLGLFGHIGVTAYVGLLQIGRPLPGETLVVSAAAGATGSLVCQIGKIIGCRVIGIAGGKDKRDWLLHEAGIDGVIDYKTEPVEERLKELCPDGIDLYYDNVGGPILDAVLGHINLHARIIAAGAISMYNDDKPAPGPKNLINLVLQRARMEGFVVLDHLQDVPLMGKIMRALGQWHAEGRLKYRVHVVDGLEKAPDAVNMLFDGSNQGKLMVAIAADPAGA